ncbi:MAG: hypothetical protein ABJF65_00535 [Reichenbachiella sp.]|uniref:hypothetical protein n=1 Tax=Reichenbachiella sp. TaxID=2184521 RepID=UPI003264F41E
MINSNEDQNMNYKSDVNSSDNKNGIVNINSDYEEGIFNYFNIFMKDDLKNLCIERGKKKYNEDDFKKDILQMHIDLGGKKDDGNTLWLEKKEQVANCLKNLGVYESAKKKSKRMSF